MSSESEASNFDAQWQSRTPAGPADRRRVQALADTLLATCGHGPVLDIGCGDGTLLRELLARGCDARGVDISPVAVALSEERSPGRTVVGDLRDLGPPQGRSFDTGVAIDVLHHLPEGDVQVVLEGFARIARRAVFLRISTLPTADRPLHLTARPRDWWQWKCFEAGLRTHARSMVAVPYEQIDAEGDSVTLVLEPIDAEAARAWPLERLSSGKQLHMDMLREPGRRADAHVARYVQAASIVRPGDMVLDVACGLGYGTHILAHNSRARHVLGMDVDGECAEYAGAMFGGSRTAFRAGDAMDLSRLADASIDLVVSFETLEHLPDPERALREFTRVLTPGGRLIVSVPNDWTDETGKDPNPHHLHTYTWRSLVQQVRDGSGGALLCEAAHAQVAGGGMKFTNAHREVRSVGVSPVGNLAGQAEPDAEWWLLTAMKDPVGATKSGYRESVFPVSPEHAGNVAAFARDYDNPWLVRSMVSLGQRATSAELLVSVAARAAAGSRAGSADQGAALCVLAYQLIESPNAGSETPASLRARIAAFDADMDGTPHAQRWRCSNWFALGAMLQVYGDLVGAEQAFLRCVACDVLAFSPLLATKTVEARWRLGLLSSGRGEVDVARAHWRAGLAEARRVAAADWRDVIADPEQPLPFALPELSRVLDEAARCAWALGLGSGWVEDPGLAWSASVQNAAVARGLLSRENEHLRAAWGAQQQAIQALTGVRDSLWSESQRVAGEWTRTQQEAERLRAERQGQEARVAAIEAEKNRVWEEQQAAIAAMEAEQAKIWNEQQRLSSAWEEQQRLLKEACDDRDRLFAETQRLAHAWEEQLKFLKDAEAARDANWAECERIGGLWEKLRRDNEVYIADIQRLHRLLGEREQSLGEREQSLAATSADRDRLAREGEALRARLNEVEAALRTLRAEVTRYSQGARYRALRALRIVHEVPKPDAG